uniref:DNA alkylation repair protein n=1 Tax=Actinomyces marmotae TaxID=2737173 RepID=UPI001F3C69DC
MSLDALGREQGHMESDAFIHDLREALAAAGDPARAEQQRAYLKSEMAMYGVGVPVTRRIAQRIAAAHPDLWREAASWEAALRLLWDGATHREERYAALAI